MRLEQLINYCYNFLMQVEYSFNGQRERELVKQVIKNHPFVLFFPGLKTIAVLIIGIAIILFIPSQFSGVIMLVCLAIGLGFFARAYYDYSQSVLIITNQRLINVRQNGFWRRNITETELSRIQDVSSDTSGFFKILLKYGDLIVRTAGATQGGEIIVKDIGNPYEVQQELAKLYK